MVKSPRDIYINKFKIVIGRGCPTKKNQGGVMFFGFSH
jgi:hypothetical protein